MQKAVALFVGNVHHVTPYSELEADARRQRCKFLQLVVRTVLVDADIVVRSKNNSIMIKPSKMCEIEDGHVSEEVVQILHMVLNMSLSTYNMLQLQGECAGRELLTGRDKLLPNVATALEEGGFLLHEGWFLHSMTITLYV